MQPDMKTRLFLLTAMLASFFAPTSVCAAETADSYQQHFKEYLEIVRYSSSSNGCVEKVKSRLQFRIDWAKNYNEEIGIPVSRVEKWGLRGPGDEEKKAAGNVLKICDMGLEELRNLAGNYRYGHNGYVQDKEAAIYLFYFMMRAYEDRDALYCLENLGANVVTEPPTKEERAASERERKARKIEFEKRQAEFEKRQAEFKDKDVELKKEMKKEMKLLHQHLFSVLPPQKKK